MVFIHFKAAEGTYTENFAISHNNGRIWKFCLAFAPNIPIVESINELSNHPTRDQHVYFGAGLNKQQIATNLRLSSSANFVPLDCSALSLQDIQSI